MRALIVDESSVIRRFIAFILKEFKDLQIVEAADGAEALQQLQNQPFDVVMLDVNLRQMGGFEVLRQLQARPGPNAATPLVMISTTCDDDTVARAKAMGVREFLAKPVPAVRIRDLIRTLLVLPVGPQTEAEKRRTPRLQVPISVSFDGEAPMERHTADISPFGAFIVSQTWKTVGSECLIKLELPHLAETLKVRCRVVHVRPEAIGPLPQGFGVRFVTDSPEDLSRLVRAFTSPEA